MLCYEKHATCGFYSYFKKKLSKKIMAKNVLFNIPSRIGSQNSFMAFKKSTPEIGENIIFRFSKNIPIIQPYILIFGTPNKPKKK